MHQSEEPVVLCDGEDWVKAEISSLLKEAQTLRSQKEQLEAQIAQAEDANASLQSSWEALSRVETTAPATGSSMVSSQRPSPSKLGEAPSTGHDDWRCNDHQATFGDEQSEVLNASQQALQLDVQILRQRVVEAEASTARQQEETLALEVQEDQAKEIAGLLQELQALQRRVDCSSKELQVLQQHEKVEALAKMTASHSQLQEERDALQAELLEQAEAAASTCARQREVAQEAQKAQRRLSEAKELWDAQVSIGRSALEVEEQLLAKLAAGQEVCHLASLEGRRASSELTSQVLQLRAEHGRLLKWQQAHTAKELDLDPFGLKATSCALRSHLQSLEDELVDLRRREAEDQAKLQSKRAEEALHAGALQEKTVAEVKAFEVCSAQLQRLCCEMTREVRSLQLELGREFSLIQALRSEVAAGLRRRSSSAPRLSTPDDLARSRNASTKLPKKGQSSALQHSAWKVSVKRPSAASLS